MGPPISVARRVIARQSLILPQHFRVCTSDGYCPPSCHNPAIISNVSLAHIRQFIQVCIETILVAVRVELVVFGQFRPDSKAIFDE